VELVAFHLSYLPILFSLVIYFVYNLNTFVLYRST